jgi:hypothetical protein
LGISPGGFGDVHGYAEWFVTRRERHGHRESLPGFSTSRGFPLRDVASKRRFIEEEVEWPLEEPLPRPCCESDPLYWAARSLSERYGLDEASMESGFERVEYAVVSFLITGRWQELRSTPPSTVVFEEGLVTTKVFFKDGVIIKREDSDRVLARYRQPSVGLQSRAGKGRKLEVWLGWWHLHQQGKHWSEITVPPRHRQRTGRDSDRRTIERGIAYVERLMRPRAKLNAP